MLRRVWQCLSLKQRKISVNCFQLNLLFNEKMRFEVWNFIGEKQPLNQNIPSTFDHLKPQSSKYMKKKYWVKLINSYDAFASNASFNEFNSWIKILMILKSNKTFSIPYMRLSPNYLKNDINTAFQFNELATNVKKDSKKFHHLFPARWIQVPWTWSQDYTVLLITMLNIWKLYNSWHF